MSQAINYSDFYKTDHRRQYPAGTELVYSNFTPRGSRIKGIDEVVVFGIQYFIKEFLIKRFNDSFFHISKGLAVTRYQRRLDNALGKDAVSMDHIKDLWNLGYLPVEIKALKEGTLCPMRVPLLTSRSTHWKFAWVTNFLETLLSTVLWGPLTSATIAHAYRKILDEYAAKTSDTPEFVDWQGHDFSMRGMMGIEAAAMSGAAHLLSFTGTDTIPAIDFLEEYYNADSDKELIGGSVPATEHSVMSVAGIEDEVGTFKRLITETYPKGIISVVSDTWDFWKVMTEYLPQLKNEIMSRDGKVVIRPDSGDPEEIICGYDSMGNNKQGAIEVLWDIFGGTVNSKGYKQLDPHIGLIYGDSITLDRCRAICKGLERKGFASTNVVLGIGSYTYQYNTRDTFGFAMKATYAVVNGKPINIWKDPKTDDGVKKSAKGLLCVDNNRRLIEEVSMEESNTGLLKTVFDSGRPCMETSLAEIRETLRR
ncbi:MAG: nicotinate phosphoribosyltransferase [Firmicutes bacterium]|nr:nicotinate phosphoribosyltransferase [Bacillota bacterium]